MEYWTQGNLQNYAENGYGQLQATAMCSIVDPANAASIRVASRVHTRSRMFRGSQGPMYVFSTNASGRAGQISG